MAQITCRNLTVGYETRVVAENLNFEVKKGDYLCVVGENGAGKTTLMKTVLGLQKPLSGSVSTGDGLSFRGIGYLSQQNDLRKDFPATVSEVVLSGFLGRKKFFPFYTESDRKTAAANMERMGVADKAEACYRELSGGQRQRVLLARALCAAEDILLLDEPVSGLDPDAAAEMYELIEKLNKEGMTIIMISHDVEEALGFATHVLRLGGGTFFGTKEEYVRFGEK